MPRQGPDASSADTNHPDDSVVFVHDGADAIRSQVCRPFLKTRVTRLESTVRRLNQVSRGLDAEADKRVKVQGADPCRCSRWNVAMAQSSAHAAFACLDQPLRRLDDENGHPSVGARLVLLTWRPQNRLASRDWLPHLNPPPDTHPVPLKT